MAGTSWFLSGLLKAHFLQVAFPDCYPHWDDYPTFGLTGPSFLCAPLASALTTGLDNRL